MDHVKVQTKEVGKMVPQIIFKLLNTMNDDLKDDSLVVNGPALSASHEVKMKALGLSK